MSLQKFNFIETNNRIEELRADVNKKFDKLLSTGLHEKINKLVEFGVTDKLDEILHNISTLAQSKNYDLMLIDEAAEFLKLKKSTLYVMVSNKKIPFIKKGKMLYFDRGQLTEWLQQGEVRPKQTEN